MERVLAAVKGPHQRRSMIQRSSGGLLKPGVTAALPTEEDRIQDGSTRTADKQAPGRQGLRTHAMNGDRSSASALVPVSDSLITLVTLEERTEASRGAELHAMLHA